ncbi:MAG: hypothetical protein LBJ32_04125 [Oscillospiraceae bacterium]|nr:hypothetical protein [Oscillospiraceae bacterium]
MYKKFCCREREREREREFPGSFRILRKRIKNSNIANALVFLVFLAFQTLIIYSLVSTTVEAFQKNSSNENINFDNASKKLKVAGKNNQNNSKIYGFLASFCAGIVGGGTATYYIKKSDETKFETFLISLMELISDKNKDLEQFEKAEEIVSKSDFNNILKKIFLNIIKTIRAVQTEENLSQESNDTTIKNLEQQVEALNEEKLNLQNENEELKNKLNNQAQIPNEALNTQIEEFEKEQQKFEKEKLNLQNENEELKNQIEEFEKEQQEFTTEKTNFESEKANFESANEELKSQNEALKNQIKEFEKEQQKFEKEKLNLQNENEELKNQSKVLNTQIGEFEKEQQEFENAKANFESANKELKNQNEELKSQIEEFKKEQQEFENAKANFESANKELKSQNEELKSQSEALNTQIENQGSGDQNEILSKEIQQLKDQIESQNLEIYYDIGKMSNVLKDFLSAESLNSIKEEIQKHEKEFSEFELGNKKINAGFELIYRLAECLKNEKNYYIDQITQLYARNQELENELASFTEQNQVYLQKIEEYFKSPPSANQSLEEADRLRLLFLSHFINLQQTQKMHDRFESLLGDKNDFEEFFLDDENIYEEFF